MQAAVRVYGARLLSAAQVIGPACGTVDGPGRKPQQAGWFSSPNRSPASSITRTPGGTSASKSGALVVSAGVIPQFLPGQRPGRRLLPERGEGRVPGQAEQDPQVCVEDGDSAGGHPQRTQVREINGTACLADAESRPAADGDLLSAGQLTSQQPARIDEVGQVIRQRGGWPDGDVIGVFAPSALPIAGDGQGRAMAVTGQVINPVLVVSNYLYPGNPVLDFGYLCDRFGQREHAARPVRATWPGPRDRATGGTRR